MLFSNENKMNYQATKKWRKHKCVDKEISQCETITHCMILITLHSGQGKTMDTGEKKSMVVKDYKIRRGRNEQMEHRGFSV